VNKETLREIGILLRPVKVRLANAIARAVVNAIDDETKIQTLRIEAHKGEDIDDAERFQNYGFTSAPLPGAEAIAVFPNGDRAHPLVVAVDDRRYRFKGMLPGEVAVYTDESGHTIQLLRGKKTVMGADDIRLGSSGASDPVVRMSDLQKVIDKVNLHTHLYIPGPPLTTPVQTLPPAVPMPPATGSDKVKAD